MNIPLIIFAAAISLSALTKAEESLPSDVQKAVDQRAAAIVKINKIYLQELEKLKVNYTKQGNLESANRIVALMQEVLANEKKSLPNNEDDLRKYLINTKWRGPNTTHTFDKDGRFRSKEHSPSYVISGWRNVTVVWAPTTSVTCVLSEDCTTMKETAGLMNVWTRIP